MIILKICAAERDSVCTQTSVRNGYFSKCDFNQEESLYDMVRMAVKIAMIWFHEKTQPKESTKMNLLQYKDDTYLVKCSRAFCNFRSAKI